MDDMVVIERDFKATAQTLFEAFTDPKIMSQWFFGGEDMSVKVDNDFRVGGHYSLDMMNKEGEVFPHHGTYQDIRPFDRLIFTWNSPLVSETLVTLTFIEHDTGCTLKLIHTGFTDPEIQGRHTQGWGTCLHNLLKLTIQTN